jgi:hypothetical protein
MRISVDERDPGHRLHAEAKAQGIDFIVTLDGVRQLEAITADDLSGEVVRHAVDALGNLKLDPARPGEALRETVRGRVRIIRKHPYWRQD